MNEQYDVVIVGAGPAGLLAARAAGQQGLKTALLDRKSDITRLDRMCGQTLVSMNDYYFGDLVNYNSRGKRIGFLNSGLSFAYDGPVKNCAAWHVYSPNGSRLPFGLPEETRSKGDLGAVGLAYDKEILFGCLLQEVKQAGVEVFTGIDVSDMAPCSSGVLVNGSGRSFTGSYVIAADGTNSRLARLWGFNRGRTFYCYLLSKGLRMRGLSLPASDILISSICFSTVAPGYMFIFPRPYEDEANVAFLTLDPRVDLDQVSRYFMEENSFFADWFRKAQVLQQQASAQYVFSPVATPYRERVLLAGDTGSCQELENTGAMLSGWKAGNAVAAAVREDRLGLGSRAIADYLKWWQEVYVDGYRHEDYIMNFALPYVLDRQDDFDYICGLVQQALPPCWNPYAASGHLGQLMQRLAPTIQKERPDLMPKLARMAQPMTEVLASTTKACEPLLELE
ncbi:MAG: FAD-binding protein [Deltaproteobacteria bacterium]|nr:FAD-binding protein [Deltaproteobacteria bacterium]